MRQIFTSPRIENVERVAQLLREHGIETRITNGRSYRGGHRMAFSYREDAGKDAPPAVWVVKSEDQPQARQLLREIGLLDSARSPTSYLPTSMIGRDREDSATERARRRAFRIKLGLLLGIGAVSAVALLAYFGPRSPAPRNGPAAAAQTGPGGLPTVHLPEGARWQVETPVALASMLLDNEAKAHGDRIVCVSVDGGDPSAEVLSGMKHATLPTLRKRSACPSGADAASTTGVDVREYMTDGSGTGQVRMDITEADATGKPRIQQRLLDVTRNGDRWRIEGIELL